MVSFLYEHRVRYREADPMGVVYHAHYLDYFEAARTEALRDAGIAYKSLEDNGLIMPVVDLSVSYRKPAHYDDLLQIETVVELSDSETRMHFKYSVRRKGENDLLVSGNVTLCFFDRTSLRPVRAPERVSALIRALEQEQNLSAPER